MLNTNRVHLLQLFILMRIKFTTMIKEIREIHLSSHVRVTNTNKVNAILPN